MPIILVNHELTQMYSQWSVYIIWPYITQTDTHAHTRLLESRLYMILHIYTSNITNKVVGCCIITTITSLLHNYMHILLLPQHITTVP